MKTTEPFVRSTEDVGNIIHLEHVNLLIPEQRLATIFYILGLGLTRDPYLVTGVVNMWVNVGQSQFHLPLGDAQRFRGHIGVVMPNRASLVDRLAGVQESLSGTQFAWSEHLEYVEATCPWGNVFRCYEGDSSRFGGLHLGIPYVELSVPVGSAEPIVDFYREIFDAPGSVDAASADGTIAGRTSVGAAQELIFRETSAPIPAYDGHHIQIYVHNFSGPHERLVERGLITEESSQHQFRFASILNLSTGKECFALEHEVRSMRHPLYARPLVNRNPSQTNVNYVRDMDAMTP